MKMVKITSKIKFIISVLSVIIIVVGAVTIYLNHKTQKDSNVINIAGKQRMLTQKIAKDIFLCDKFFLASSKDLENAIHEFETSLNDLIKGNEKKGIYAPPSEDIESSLLLIQKNWLDFMEDIKIYREKKEFYTKNKENLIYKNQELLEKSDMLVRKMITLNLDGSYIDRSGKQRMLTQKMAFHISSFISNRSSFDFKSFYEAMDNYEKTLLVFSQDSTIKSNVELYDIVNDISALFEEFKKDSYQFVDNELALDKILDKIALKNVMLLDSMDEIVTSYSNYSKAQRNFLQNFQYIATILAIIFIIYSFVLVNDIQRLFHKFLSHSKDISNITTPNQPVMFAEDEPTDELSVASKHIDTFANNINDIIAEANKALEDSKKAIEKLANISQTEVDFENIEDKNIKKALDTSEDIAIQSLQDLANTANMLKKLQQNFNSLNK
ncbi:type IV pili methyl-accepting chemotaxis transducer N-terminal domain-containing protein [Arcobacter sp. FWKO B]|uniref:type IV pili methyl-accepting chemotaxis transducer N-terminal domain-containing protein n=1 Tax=Arcobacter sp. FWKO B TaxID=2593672 RepID=UPI0018A66517|nr:type IV pili methyl-accepting chemotaxis transducer N-terminal domain-containing protein [Arcobacter sp. FWKO B]QOG11913.1 hypothetical protein FWKOB_03995 [Arcobacter sp. FWKO B]